MAILKLLIVFMLSVLGITVTAYGSLALLLATLPGITALFVTLIVSTVLATLVCSIVYFAFYRLCILY